MSSLFATIFAIALIISETQARHVHHKKQHSFKHHLKAKSAETAQSDDYELPTNGPAIEILPTDGPAMVIDPQTVGPVYPAIPSFSSVFPVEVDMSHFMSALEARLASIESSISENQASIASHASSISDHENSLSNHEDSISSFENSISNHEDSISSHESSISNHEDKIASNLASITGNVEGISSLRDELQGLASKSRSFCQMGRFGSNSVGGSDEDNTRTKKEVKDTVYFPTAFPSEPTVAMALSDIYMKDPNDDGDYYGWSMSANEITTSSFEATLIADDYTIYEMYASWIACVTV